MAQISQYLELYPMMTPELPGCPDPVKLQALQRGGRQFCERTEAWREFLESIDLVDETVDYDLQPEYNAEIRKIVAVRINTEEGVTNGDDGALQDKSLYEWDPDTEILTLDDSLEPTEDITSGLDVKVVLVPYLTTSELPQWFINRYADYLVAWAMVDLMTRPEKEWSNMVRAKFYQTEYQRGVGIAKKDVADEYKEENDGMQA